MSKAFSYSANGYSYGIQDPAGRRMQIPADMSEDFPYFTIEQRDELQSYYRENGYVVIRNLFPRELCETARRAFESELKPFKGFIYRQATANPERNVFTSNGFVLNSILNIQSLDRRRFPAFCAAGLAILTHPNARSIARALLGEDGKLVQSMYFEGNPATWPHQDTYYLDAEEIGRMTAGWFAMEDISPGAGRFFVYPKSHLLDMAKNGGDFDVAFHHDRYKKLAVDVIRRRNLECRAPALGQGDALFWAAKTMHGSLETIEPRRSRCSFTGHYIPESSRLLQFQARFRGLNIAPINGMNVHRPKDLNRASRRAILGLETTFPNAFQTAKKLAIKLLTR
jgi:phytanoyl-CoA hydroxylase